MKYLTLARRKLPIARMYARIIAPLIMNMANGFVIHSEYDRELLKKHYNLDKRLIVLIPHGPYYQYHETSEKQKFPNTETSCCNLLFFGVIRPYKGLEDLIMAFDSLPQSVINTFRLTVVGETWEGWDEPSTLIEQSQYRNHITFVNRYVTDEEVVKFFADADAIVLPYHRSSTSGPLHIAMSYGLPVIVTKVGGLVEAVKNYEGAMLVEPKDVVALQKALLQVTDLCGRHYSNPRSWEYTNTKYQALFDALEASSSSSPLMLTKVALSIHLVQQRELTKKQ